MNEKYKAFEKSIKKKHHFAWTPRHVEVFKTSIKPTIISRIAQEVFEHLAWEAVYMDEKSAEAFHLDRYGYRKEKISITATNYGEVKVQSESAGNEMWDQGRNSKTVKLFIYVFKDLVSQYDTAAQDALEEKMTKEKQWDDYEIPAHLPSPPDYRTPSVVFAVLFGIVTSVVISFIWAQATILGLYVLILFELLVGLGIGIALSKGLSKGNFTDFGKIQLLLGFMTLFSCFMYHFFQYFLSVIWEGIPGVSFMQFFYIRMEHGLSLKEMNLGAWGWFILWCVQPILLYLTGLYYLGRSLLTFMIDRVPPEVIDFAYYHFLQGRNESQVGAELAKMGWKTKASQTAVFEALGSVVESQEMNRG